MLDTRLSSTNPIAAKAAAALHATEAAAAT
ncbi:hypothetical protein P3T35_005465 [Kitasatospora sp. GP30]|nr:hypothetical protein [Kitasatospora sp. GP30]